MVELTVGEIQKNLLGILRDAVVARAAIYENPGPLNGDVIRIEMEKRRLDTAVQVATACCLAADLDESSVQFMIGAPIVNLTSENLVRSRRTVP